MKRSIYCFITALIVLSILGANAKTSSNKIEVSHNLNIFNDLFKELQTNYVDTIDAKKAIRNAIDAMLMQLDPYTEYFPVEEQENFTSMSSGEFSGIGSYIMQRNGHIELSEPQWGSPSRKAGVRHGDILIAIDGDTLPYGYPSAEASARLRGASGTKLKLTVKRPYVTSDSILDIEVTRGTIRTDPVPYYGMLRDGVGYIKLTTFNERSASEVREALLALKKDPELQGLILDLRDNGGGLLESAVQIAGYFVPKGTEIVRTKYRERDEQIYKTTQKPIDTSLPLAILVNGGTASASEIVSGALQDLDRAVIIGERSFGKGLVQASRPLPYDGVLKLTVARYYIPSGRLIQAIDYSHRNPDGTVARVPDSLTNVFHTVAGREVRDGGGITPDIKTTQPEYNRLTYNVVADFWAYDYANRFAARQPQAPNAETFEITDSIFDDFKGFIDPNKFKYDRLCETGLSLLREAANNEGYMNDSVAAEFDRLENMLKHDLNHDLDFNRQMLNNILDEEISKRYFDDATQIKRIITHNDIDVDAAIEMFATPGEYQKLLSPTKK